MTVKEFIKKLEWFDPNSPIEFVELKPETSSLYETSILPHKLCIEDISLDENACVQILIGD